MRVMTPVQQTVQPNTTNPFWYLDRTNDDLKGVTSEASNPDLGILGIDVTSATAEQVEKGVLAKVSVRTIVGNLYNISICQAKRNAQALRVQLPSHLKTTDSGNPNWMNEFTLSLKCKAQILSYVSTLVVHEA